MPLLFSHLAFRRVVNIIAEILFGLPIARQSTKRSIAEPDVQLNMLLPAEDNRVLKAAKRSTATGSQDP